MDSNSIKSKTISGAIWKLLERVLAQGVTLVVSIVIARILDPKDYGVVSIVTIFFIFANIIISGGLNTALIQKKNAEINDYSTVLVSSVILAATCYAILFFAAPYISNIYNQPLLIPVIRVMGITLIISAVKSVWCAYISAHLQFRKFFFATLGGTLFSAVVGISMALNGMGPWALVGQQMSNAIIDTIILAITVKIRLPLYFSIKRFKALFSYSWKILVSSLIGTTYSELIPLIIGVKYSSTDLSFYTKGRQFPGNISSTVTNTLSAVLFPALSKFQDSKERILRYTRLFIRVSSYIVFPMMLGFAAVADNFTIIILKEKWLPAVYYMRVFSFACMFNMIHLGNCETIKAIGRSDIYLKIEIIKKVCYFSVIILFLFLTDSPRKLVLAFVVNEVIAIIVNSIPNIKLIGYQVRYQIKDLIPNLLLATFMAVCVYFIGKINIKAFLLLPLQIVCGFLIYLLLSIITNNSSFRYLVQLLKDRRNKKVGR